MDSNHPEYVDLHPIAKRIRNEDLDINGPHYFCAILKDHKTPYTCESEDDFIWAKVKGHHDIQKLKSIYPADRRDQVSFCLDGTFPDPTTTIQSLDKRGDKVVVFWAVNNSRKQTMSSRQPLQQVDPQSAARTLHPLSEMPRPVIKPEPMDETRMTGQPVRFPQSGSVAANGFASPAESSPMDPGFAEFQQLEIQKLLQNGWPQSSNGATGGMRLTIKNNWNTMTAAQRAPYIATARAASRTVSGTTPQGSSSAHQASSVHRMASPSVASSSGTHHPYGSQRKFKNEDESPDQSSDELDVPRVSKAAEKSRLQKLLGTASPEVLETEVEKGKELLERLANTLAKQKDHSPDAQQWLQQVEKLQKEVISTPTIIGVVGNTGSGKSSTINALLDEERLLPTNCMRACTAVVTELSWNPSEDENQKYRAAIEFIRPEDWEKELKVLFQELFDAGGEVSRDCTNPDTEAGIAYAKIKAVYPRLTKETMTKATVEQLMGVEEVSNVLGTVKNIAHKNVDIFYQRLQRYVDSKEKSDKKEKGAKKEKKEKGAAFAMEYWPLIKVVKIYTKAAALSTGATLVDLPGVHDANAARAAVAQGYMKQCTGLFVVAPINRAVDDKAAKSLLGETFKRQLKYDGTYSRVTFICSKTDDISITEAADSLGIQDEMSDLWEEQDSLEKQKKELETTVKDLQESKAVYTGVFEDADENLETWEDLLSKLQEGETVYAPKAKPTKDSKESKKRKRSESPKKKKKAIKKRKIVSDDSDDEEDDDEDDIIDEVESVASEADDDDDAEESGEESGEDGERPFLKEEEIQSKIDEFKTTKKKSRQERTLVEDQIKEVKSKIKTIQSKIDEIEGQIAAKCISGRNNYSKGAIQVDFAQGIKELDQENAAEEDEENFNPEVDIRDYEKVARSLPVFCVSARGYQKLCGRLKRDGNVAGFKTTEETEIPQLQAHCKKLTEEGRGSNCRRFLNTLSQLTNSLSLWASNDGSGMNLTEAQRNRETENLKKKLGSLEKAFDKEVEDRTKDLKESLQDFIFDKYPDAIRAAAENAPVRCAHWNAPVDKFDRAAGGYYWATYRAIVRRNGVYSNAQGLHDWNAQLCEPIMKRMATEWEKVFQRKFPTILKTFAKGAKQKLLKFHAEIEKRCLERGVGHAGIMMIKQQLVNYERSFLEHADALTNVAQEHQREASRGFQPVIEQEMVPSYEHCQTECGPGCFKRMKSHMTDFIADNKDDMFPKSCTAVQDQLKSMCREIEAGLSDAADEAFVRIQRDYMQVVVGVQLPQGQVMSKAERVLRAEICQLLEEDNKADEENKADEDAVMTDDKNESAVKPEARDVEHAEAASQSKAGGAREGADADSEAEDLSYDDDKENQVAKDMSASSDDQSD